jgi:hypothetical protein
MAKLAWRSWDRVTSGWPTRRSRTDGVAAEERRDRRFERLEALGRRRILVLALDRVGEVRDGEPRVRDAARGGDHAQVDLVGAGADRAEILERRAAQRRSRRQLVPAADVGERHRRADAASDLFLFGHVRFDRTGTESVSVGRYGEIPALAVANRQKPPTRPRRPGPPHEGAAKRGEPGG